MYHCQKCEYSPGYNEILQITKLMHYSMFQTNTVEISIIYLITNYAKSNDARKCCIQFTESLCAEQIMLKYVDDKIIDESINCGIEGVSCNDCGTDKQCQGNDETCKIYLEYDGKEYKNCIKCYELLCNRCIIINGYEYCHLCNRYMCWKCARSLMVLCAECEHMFCNKCIGSKCEQKYGSYGKCSQ